MRARPIALAVLLLIAVSVPAPAQMTIERDSAPDWFPYARLGVGSMFGDQVYTAPAFTLIGFRGGLGSFGFDASFINAQFWGDSDQATTDAQAASAASILKFEVLHYRRPDADRTLYSGVGLGLGTRTFGALNAGAPYPGTVGRRWAGAGWQGELSAGYEVNRRENVRPFFQLDVTLPLYQAVTYGGGSERYAPSVALSVGVGFQRPVR